jgi:hypothetical protein
MGQPLHRGKGKKRGRGKMGKGKEGEGERRETYWCENWICKGRNAI